MSGLCITRKSTCVFQNIKAEKLHKRPKRQTFDLLKAVSRLTHPVLLSINNMEAVQTLLMKILRVERLILCGKLIPVVC